MSVFVPSNIHRRPFIQFRLSNPFRPPMFIHKRPSTDVRPQMSVHRCPSTNVRPPMFVHKRPSTDVHPPMFVHKRPSIDVRPLPFIPVDIIYYSNCMLCWNFVTNVLYYYKILGHGTTPCRQMMKALPLNQSQGINYEITHNHLSRFLCARDLHNGTIKHLQRHRHPIQLLLWIQVQVTLHQQYIKVHLEGLINGVHLLPHQLSHHHRIFHCKPRPLHPCTPWRLIVPLGELKSSMKG